MKARRNDDGKPADAVQANAARRGALDPAVATFVRALARWCARRDHVDRMNIRSDLGLHRSFDTGCSEKTSVNHPSPIRLASRFQTKDEA